MASSCDEDVVNGRCVSSCAIISRLISSGGVRRDSVDGH